MPNVADFGNGYHIHVTGLIHDETGFPVGNPKVTREAIDRLHKKIAIAQDEITHVEEYCMEDAEYAVVAFGVLPVLPMRLFLKLAKGHQGWHGSFDYHLAIC